MASITGNGSKGHHKFILTVTQSSQNVANNTSTVSYKFQIAPIQTSWNWEQWADAISYSFTINGTKYTGTIPNYDGYSTVTLKSGTQTVTHNSDGTKSISYSLSVTDTSGVSYTSGNASASGTLALTTIARATTPTLSATNVTANGSNSVTITIAPASSSFKHKVRYDFGSLTGQSSGMSVGSDFTAQGNVSVTFKPPSSLCSQIPSAKSGTLTIKLYTYTSSGTHIGTKSVTMTLTVPSYMPSIGVPEISGQNLLSGAYVAGKSHASIFFDVNTSYGATIKEKDISATIDGKTYNSNAFNTSVFSSGSKSLSIKVTDSRGYESTYVTPSTDMITVYAYSKPTITEFTLARQSDGTTVVATVKGSISAVNNKNAKTIKVVLNGVTKTITSSTYTINGTTTFTDVPTDSTFTGKATITDSYTSANKEAVLPTVEVTMDFLVDGKGVAFGKVAENSGFLDVNWNLYCRKNFSINNSAFAPFAINRTGSANGAAIKFVNSNGTLGFVGMANAPDSGLFRWNASSSASYLILDVNNTKDYVVEQGTSNYWTYRKWNSGVAECWKTVDTSTGAFSGTSPTFYSSPGTTYAYPTNLFTSVKSVQLSVAENSGAVLSVFNCSGTDNTYCEPAYIRLYGGSTAVTIKVSFFISGTWK